MASSDQGLGRKRTLADPCSSSQPYPKCPRIASSCSSTASPHINSCSAIPDSQHCYPSSSASTSCDTPCNTSASSSGNDPFPRYSLGIPHLDLLLPVRDGLDLLHAYHQGIGWIYTPVDRTTLLETLEEAERHGADSIHPHRLACLLAALALGDLFSPCFSPSAASSSRSESMVAASTKRGRIWFGVASACLAGSRKNIELMHNPTPDACSALYLMSTYLLCSNDEELFHRSQGLTGLALILAKSALYPSCAPSMQARSASQASAPSVASRHQAAADMASATSSGPASSSASPLAVAAANAATDQDRLHCTRLLSDLIFHLRCQSLTFALPCPFASNSTPQSALSLANFPDVPTIQAIWTAFGTPLYASLDAFGSRYSPNIFHNWKLGLADLMHQVSTLTNQAITLDNLTSPFTASCSAETATSDQRKESKRITLPEHSHVVKLDERIRRYHASLPDFLLLHKPLPFEMAGKVDEDELAQIICQRHVACSMVHRMLMALHRPWFLSALACKSRAAKADTTQLYRSPVTASEVSATSSESQSDQNASKSEATEPVPTETPSSSAMFSLSAVLRSATWQTETYASATACAPPQALAWWQFTNNALAAAVVQATALLRLSCPLRSNDSAAEEATTAQKADPSSHFHTQVRSDLDKNICSFQNVAKRCKLAAKALPFLQRVSSAIDLGICKSRSPSGQDALQSGVLTEQSCRAASTATSPVSTPSSTTDKLTRTCSDRVLSSFTFNNISNSHRDSISSSTSNSNSTSNSSSNSISNSNISTSNSNCNTHVTKSDSLPIDGCNASNSASCGVDSSLHNSSTLADLNGSQHDRSTDARRASSAKSELEAIFGPIASGLERSKASAAQAPMKPLYRQSWEPIPVPPSTQGSREGDDQSFQPRGDDLSSQPPSSDDAGSSSASSGSGTCPQTPRSASPQLNAESGVQEGSATDEVKSAEESRKKRNSASDLVLECIRFWQPEMLSSAAARRE